MAKISIAIPTHDMPNGEYFLGRLQRSLDMQTFRDFEIVITKNGLGMASNTNEAIRQSRGELIKILFMDDYLAHENALQEIVNAFKGGWLVTGCGHDDGGGIWTDAHFPEYNKDIHTGNNTIGSPSVLTIRNKEPLLFDETMTWLLDCDYYRRLYDRYGVPDILNKINVIIGVGNHQMTHTLGDDLKIKERNYLLKKYG